MMFPKGSIKLLIFLIASLNVSAALVKAVDTLLTGRREAGSGEDGGGSCNHLRREPTGVLVLVSQQRTAALSNWQAGKRRAAGHAVRHAYMSSGLT